MALPTFKAFLSHRYESYDVNLRFFDLLTAFARVQFEVDVGSKATNVTRLERFVRDADAFVGIYPFDAVDDVRPSREEVLKKSRYFRLELDMAVRFGKPGIVFVDLRYGNAITVPPTLRECRYDHREIAVPGPLRGEAQLLDQARLFAEAVGASMQRHGDAGAAKRLDRVGLLLPTGAKADLACTAADVKRLVGQLKKMSLEPVMLDASRGADGDFMRQLDSLDWMLTDIGAAACAGGLPAYVHGRFIPQMRLLRSPSAAAPARSPLEDGLLKSFEVGYPKDIVRWHDGKALDKQFVQRLSTLYETRQYIGSAAQAQAYFARAALRKDAVFLSYAGDDRSLVEGVALALRRSFQNVFDYRDQGESIVPGSHWLEEIFNKLSGSALAVPFLSPAYFDSGNCKHEARAIIAMADNRKIKVVPVKLRDGPLDPPEWMKDIQYLRGWEYPAAEVLAEKIVKAYDEALRRADPAAKASG